MMRAHRPPPADGGRPITHEVVAEATARYLAAGGAIRRLPDTIEMQRRRLLFDLAQETMGKGDHGAGIVGADAIRPRAHTMRPYTQDDEAARP